MNLAGGQAHGTELIARGAPGIEVPVMRLLRLGKPARELLARTSGLLKSDTHLGADLIPRGADRWPDCGDEIAGTAAELATQCFNGDLRYPGSQTAPARMRRSNTAGAAIADQQRHAIGSLNGERDRGVVCHQDVSVLEAMAAFPALFVHHDCRSMHLSYAHQIQSRNAYCPCNFVPPRHALAIGRGTQDPRSGREQMIGAGVERFAHQRRPVSRLHPLEASGKLRKHI